MADEFTQEGEKPYQTERVSLLNLIKENNIKVNNIELLNKLLNKLDEEIELLYEISQHLINDKKFLFSIEVYESDGDLENLYFVIHFPKESKSDEEYEDKIISELKDYQETIDKQNLLWFIGFAS